MDELVRWLGEQLDEDERIAREAGERSFEWKLATPLDDAELGDAHWLRPVELKHVERHDPARVLREVEAKRRIIEQHERYAAERRRMMGGWDPQSDDSPILAALAIVYADRPGYQESWRP